MRLAGVLGAGAFVMAHAAIAQEGNWMVPALGAKPGAAAAAAAATGPVLKAGTEVPLKLSDTAKGKKLGVGQRLPLAVATDVRLGTSVVIPAGAVAEGEITALEGKNVAAAKVLNVRVAGKLVRLIGSFGGPRGRAFLGEDIKVAQ
jgi:hypothetical protein